jgi:hypothetical protein
MHELASFIYQLDGVFTGYNAGGIQGTVFSQTVAGT